MSRCKQLCFYFQEEPRRTGLENESRGSENSKMVHVTTINSGKIIEKKHKGESKGVQF